MDLYDKGIDKMLKRNFIEWQDGHLQYLMRTSVVNKDVGVNLNIPLQQNVKPETFKTKLNIKKIVSFIFRDHPLHPISLETLDDDINVLNLYKIIEAPLDISSYSSVYMPFGINPILDMRGNHLFKRK